MRKRAVRQTVDVDGCGLCEVLERHGLEFCSMCGRNGVGGELVVWREDGMLYSRAAHKSCLTGFWDQHYDRFGESCPAFADLIKAGVV